METKSEFTTIDNQKIHIEWVLTNKNDELGLVMLHGWGGATKSFTDPLGNGSGGLAQEIARNTGKNVLCIDYPGFGKSTMPPKNGWNSLDYAKLVKKILEKLEIKETTTLFGHSNGGRIIIRMVKELGWEGKLILCGASGIKVPKSAREKVIGLIKKPLKPMAKLLPAKLKKVITAKVLRAHDWANAPEALKKTLTKITNEEDFKKILPAIKNKVLLLWGRHDTMTPLSSGETYKNGLKNSELKVYDGLHALHRSHTAQIGKDIAQFLS